MRPTLENLRLRMVSSRRETEPNPAEQEKWVEVQDELTGKRFWLSKDTFEQFMQINRSVRGRG